jgi:hypothetical protein
MPSYGIIDHARLRAALQEENDMTLLSAETQCAVAHGLFAKFSRDYSNRFTPFLYKIEIDRLMASVKECGIEHHHLAGAYFVECGFEDNSKLKDAFDRAIQRVMGDPYAMSFLTALANLELAKREAV